LNHPGIALADQIADRQAVTAIAHGYFCHEAQMGYLLIPRLDRL
jgi:hypothetical protein